MNKNKTDSDYQGCQIPLIYYSKIFGVLLQPTYICNSQLWKTVNCQTHIKIIVKNLKKYPLT